MTVDVQIEEGVDNENEQPTTQQAPRVDAKEIARAIAEEMSAGRNAPAMTQTQRERKLEKVIGEMVGSGVPEAGIKQVLKILDSYMEDRESEYEQRALAMDYDRFNKGTFALAEECISELTSKISAGGRLNPGLVAEMSEIVKTDSQFKDLKEKLGRGQRLTKAEMSKVAAKAFDDYCTEAGVSRKQPIDLKSSKPKPGGGSAFDEGTLDRETRKMYLAVKNRLGEQKAQQYVKEHLRG